MAYHGYKHESFYALTLDQQKDVMHKSRGVFWKHLNIRAEGFRTPSGDWRAETPAMLVEAGVTYSSSMRGDDRPYLVNVPGFDTPLVEIPGRWEMTTMPPSPTPARRTFLRDWTAPPATR